MNGYKAFYKGKEIEVHAETSIKARDEAVKIFKAKKAYEVRVILCEKDGNPVIHTAID